ncbi:hypothetical protein [Pseudonocardia parietis]|uniref:DUF1877 family protein n=1 Tax=Pseudonocardia parietis TaxID=570936 RepID=A0ABS4W6R8_9PSEU|nr:hypothetical protein [Pseudonocardia parietis]MBP2371681.1 hypothetical protein [Pseudonocardia parietis]
MGVTFCPGAPADGPQEWGASIVCPAHPPQDQRYFADYDAAVAGLADHLRFCTDPYCGDPVAYGAFVVVHYSTDQEPSLEVSSVNARLLLRALGLAAELGADDVREPAPGGAPPPLPEEPNPLIGSLTAEQMLGRVELALALAPPDPGLPARDLNATNYDFGRVEGYLQDRLAHLREIALYAREHQRDVVWH